LRAALIGLPLAAESRRAKDEETSLRLQLPADTPEVHSYQRFWQWAGIRYHQTDHFFVAPLSTRPDVIPGAPTPMEQQTLLGYRWWSSHELRASDEVFEPSELADILDRLAPRTPADA
jgi:hypothetical protein